MDVLARIFVERLPPAVCLLPTSPHLLAQIFPTGMGTAQWVFLAGLVLLIFILLTRSRRHFRQVAKHQANASFNPEATATVNRPSSVAADSGLNKRSSRQHEQWEVSMHELARDLSGQLDSKIRMLELLIREANQAASRLETAIGRSRGTGEAHSARPVKPQASFKPPVERPAAQRRLATASPRAERVYALADAGLSPTTIANQIGSQLGEVELILSLRTPQS